jgi:hypothetical protein
MTEGAGRSNLSAMRNGGLAEIGCTTTFDMCRSYIGKKKSV